MQISKPQINSFRAYYPTRTSTFVDVRTKTVKTHFMNLALVQLCT